MSRISDMPDLATVPPSSVQNSALYSANRFGDLATNLSSSVSILIQENQPKVRSSKLSQLRALGSLKAFKKKNNLTVDPHYEISSWFTVGSLGAAGSAETALNTTFFSIASDGLVQAATLAALVSLVNVILGFGIGYLSLRYSLHIERKHRFWTIPTSLSGLFVGFIFNLGLGSYRQALTDQLNTGGETIQIFANKLIEVLSSPMSSLSLDLQSFILVILGLVIFGFSAYKGLRTNDPYPEYASRHLTYLEADEQLTQTEQDIRDALSKELHDFRDSLKEETAVIRNSQGAVDIDTPKPDQVQAFLDWQSDRVTKMIQASELIARNNFEQEELNPKESIID
jgi:hypothetical protein